MNVSPLGRSLPTTPTPPDTSRPSKHQLRTWSDAVSLHGNTEAFARLYESCHGWVLARCRARLSTHDAEDVCAEVFARTWRHLSAGKTIEHPLAWLSAVTRHLIIDHHRRTKRVIPVGDLINDTDQIVVPDLAPSPAALAADTDITPLVVAWLAGLSPAAYAAVAGHMSTEDQTRTSTHAGCSRPRCAPVCTAPGNTYVPDWPRAAWSAHRFSVVDQPRHGLASL